MTNPFRNNVALLLNFNVPFRTVIGLNEERNIAGITSG